MAAKALQLKGRRFGMLLVIKRLENIDGKSFWRCRCDCGRYNETKGIYLVRGATRSCGCLVAFNNRRHGHSAGTPTYRSWSGMKTRCQNPSHHEYHRYGGRGISICKRWLKFENFLADMGERPNGMTLERKNNNLGYVKSNCRWATYKEQAQNTYKNVMLSFKGETRCMKEMSKKYGIKRTTLGRRLKAGWDVARSLTQPVRPTARKGGVTCV